MVFDGFGRQVRSEQHEDGTKCIATIQSYDGLGRVEEVGNPLRENSCRSSSLTVPSVKTQYDYDALGRVTRITYPDGSSATTDYSSNTTTFADEARNKRKTVSDALGRLTQVTEDPDGLAYATSYSYDALDNLTRVTQGSQSRTFGYDSLGRLLCASNPESRVGSAACNTATLPTTGVDRYSYDGNSNLTSHTNARGVTVSTTYDRRDRPTGISYSDSTPDIKFCYEGKDFSGSACTGSPVVGRKGRLTAAGSSVSTTRYLSFNARGQVVGSSQQTAARPTASPTPTTTPAAWKPSSTTPPCSSRPATTPPAASRRSATRRHRYPGHYLRLRVRLRPPRRDRGDQAGQQPLRVQRLQQPPAADRDRAGHLLRRQRQAQARVRLRRDQQQQRQHPHPNHHPPQPHRPDPILPLRQGQPPHERRRVRRRHRLVAQLRLRPLRQPRRDHQQRPAHLAADAHRAVELQHPPPTA